MGTACPKFMRARSKVYASGCAQSGSSFILNQLYYCADCLFTSRRQTMEEKQRHERSK
jgi:hypothetical protein